jgi:hypothetical protein
MNKDTALLLFDSSTAYRRTTLSEMISPYKLQNKKPLICYCINVQCSKCNMQVKMVEMFSYGVEVDRRMLSDRFTVQHRGKIVISHETD